MIARDRKTHKRTIRGVFANSPAGKAGIQNGTLLEAVDDQPVEEVTALLTGSAGSKVTLGLLKREMTETNRLELVRAEFVNRITLTNDIP